MKNIFLLLLINIVLHSALSIKKFTQNDVEIFGKSLAQEIEKLIEGNDISSIVAKTTLSAMIVKELKENGTLQELLGKAHAIGFDTKRLAEITGKQIYEKLQNNNTFINNDDIKKKLFLKET
jgi:hypothetical protein